MVIKTCDGGAKRGGSGDTRNGEHRRKKSGGAKSQTKRPSQGKGKAASTASRRKPRAYMPNVLARGIAAAVCAFLALLVILGMFQVHGCFSMYFVHFLFVRFVLKSYLCTNLYVNGLKK